MPKKELTRRQKSREYTPLLAHRIRELAEPEVLRNNAHDYKRLSQKHGVSQSLLREEVKEILRAMQPNHEYFSDKPVENRWVRERTANMLDAIFSTKGLSKKKVWQAAQRNLDRRMKTGFEPDRETRTSKLINSLHYRINRGKQKTRYQLLNEFMDRHGYGYEKLKDDLYAIAYATIPGKNKPGKNTGRGRDAANAAKTIRQKSLGKKARVVSEWFVQHLPELDLERIREMHPTKNKKVLAMQERWAQTIGKIAGLEAKQGTHPVAAYAKAWQAAGYKEHKELPGNEALVYAIHHFTEGLAQGIVDHDYAKQIGVSGDWSEMLGQVEQKYGIYPGMGNADLLKRIDDANAVTWKSNHDKAMAVYQYRQAEVKHGKKIGKNSKELLKAKGDEIAQHLKAGDKWWSLSKDAKLEDSIVLLGWKKIRGRDLPRPK